MAAEKKVADASVIVKLFVHEEHSDIAIDLLQKHSKGEVLLIVPELLFLEVLNALRYKHQDKEALVKVNKQLWELQFRVERLNSFLLAQASAIALEKNLSIYDAVYVALAQNFGVPLITADKALKNISNAVFLGV